MIFPFTFVFINALITSPQAKTSLQTSFFFDWNMCFLVFLIIWCKWCKLVFLWSKIISCDQKRNVSFLFSLIMTQKLERLFSVRKKMSLHNCAIEPSQLSLHNFTTRACLEQGVPWHSDNYIVWVHSETRTWHDKNIQSVCD